MLIKINEEQDLNLKELIHFTMKQAREYSDTYNAALSLKREYANQLSKQSLVEVISDQMSQIQHDAGQYEHEIDKDVIARIENQNPKDDWDQAKGAVLIEDEIQSESADHTAFLAGYYSGLLYIFKHITNESN